MRRVEEGDGETLRAGYGAVIIGVPDPAYDATALPCYFERITSDPVERNNG